MDMPRRRPGGKRAISDIMKDKGLLADVKHLVRQSGGICEMSQTAGFFKRTLNACWPASIRGSTPRPQARRMGG